MAAKAKRVAKDAPRAFRDELTGLREVLATGGAHAGLLAEVRHALEVGPPLASLHHDEMADAHWSYLASIGERCRANAVKMGIDVDRRFKLGAGSFAWDFGIEPWRAIEARYQANVAYLATQGSFLPMWSVPAMMPGGFAMPGWLAKLLSLLGVDPEDLKDVGETFTEEIGDDLLGDLKHWFSEAVEDIAEGKWEAAENKLATAVKKLGEFLERLVDRLDDFLEKLVRKLIARLGRNRALAKAADIGRKLASKVVPGIGWFLFLLELLWLLMKNIGAIYV